MKMLWAGALLVSALLAGVNAASADMCNSDPRDAAQNQNCGLEGNAAGMFAPSLLNSLYSPQSQPVIPGGPTLLGSTTMPTGIDGLVVDGTTYNVTFSTTTLNSFTDGSTLSIDATNALAAALNTLGVTELDGQTGTDYLLDVDNSLAFFNGASCSGQLTDGCRTGNWGFSIDSNKQFKSFLGTYTEAADFTPVPEPGTVGLFGMALLAVGGLGLRRKFA